MRSRFALLTARIWPLDLLVQSGVMPGRTLVIGDIHGCDIALETLLAMLAPGAADTVVLLGDLIDRGPDARRIIEILLELRRECQLISGSSGICILKL